MLQIKEKNDLIFLCYSKKKSPERKIFGERNQGNITTIVAGDFNTVLHRKDRVNEKISSHITSKPIQELDDLIRRGKLTDVIAREHCPGSIFTFTQFNQDPCDPNVIKYQSRIDHVLVRELTPNSVQANVVQDGLVDSDHSLIIFKQNLAPILLPNTASSPQGLPRIKTRIGADRKKNIARIEAALEVCELDSEQIDSLVQQLDTQYEAEILDDLVDIINTEVYKTCAKKLGICGHRSKRRLANTDLDKIKCLKRKLNLSLRKSHWMLNNSPSNTDFKQLKVKIRKISNSCKLLKVKTTILSDQQPGDLKSIIRELKILKMKVDKRRKTLVMSTRGKIIREHIKRLMTAHTDNPKLFFRKIMKKLGESEIPWLRDPVTGEKCTGAEDRLRILKNFWENTLMIPNF